MGIFPVHTLETVPEESKAQAEHTARTVRRDVTQPGGGDGRIGRGSWRATKPCINC